MLLKLIVVQTHSAVIPGRGPLIRNREDPSFPFGSHDLVLVRGSLGCRFGSFFLAQAGSETTAASTTASVRVVARRIRRPKSADRIDRECLSAARRAMQMKMPWSPSINITEYNIQLLKMVD